MKDLKIGDLVKLKSGGPSMTVSGKDVHDEWLCMWFNGESLEEESFHVDTLISDE